MKHLNTLSSMADELYSEPRKQERSGWWKWALAIILVSLFVYRSTRTAQRLQAAPPPSFYDYSKTWTPTERLDQRRVADAYWRVAVRRIQVYYSADEPLPSNPPPQFRISESARSLDSDVAASRVYYWHRLREVWHQPDAWTISYGWNTDWVESTASSIPQYIPQWVSNIFQGIIVFFDGITQRISAP